MTGCLRHQLGLFGRSKVPHIAFFRREVGRIAGIVRNTREGWGGAMDANNGFRARVPKPNAQERTSIPAIRDEPAGFQPFN
jgi:hypothetical protein